jgi:drug/metabolite transporter (DMT)-like permease
VTWGVLGGSLLIMVGIFLLLWRAMPVVSPSVDVGRRSRFDWRGAVLLLMIATVFWTLSTTWLRAGSGNLGPVSAGALRAGGTTLFLLPATLGMRRESSMPRFAWSSVASVAAAGILAVGIGSLFYIAAVQEAGAGRTAILTSTMPLFNLPLAVLFLRERVTPRIIAGTIIGIAGIWLIV